MKKNSKFKKYVAVLVAGAMFLTSFNMPFAQTESKAAGYGISNPRVEKDVLISGDDSEKPEGTISNPVVKANVTTWDCITFGNYWQEDTNGDGKIDQTDEKQPIKWRVLSVDGDDAFLLADNVLDFQPYNKSGKDVNLQDTTWENCSLRKWLNEDFMSAAFSEGEQESIIETKVQNGTSDNENETLDKVYLLSKEEVSDPSLGFENARARKIERKKEWEYDAERWWLRSSGGRSGNVIDENGSQGEAGGFSVGVYNSRGIRPVIHLNLSALKWDKADAIRLEIIHSTYDHLYFGQYYEDESSTVKQPIKWRVLSVNGDDAFLLADEGLDCQRYNESEEAVTWETSTIRKWLNETFMKEAFNEKEQNSIKDTMITTENSEDTTDKVFLLSKEDVGNVTYGFDPVLDSISGTRSMNITNYCKSKGARMWQIEYFSGFYDPWWLRTTEKDNTCAASASMWNGIVYSSDMTNSRHAVRPAIHIDLSKATWKDEETVAKESQKDYGVADPVGEESRSKWDSIYFGNYWQNDTNGDGKADQNDEKKPIKWRVLSVKGKEALILADQVLDWQSYSDDDTPVGTVWKDSAISLWLNQNFLNNAFTSEEQAAINKTRIVYVQGKSRQDDQSDYVPVYLLGSGELQQNYQLYSVKARTTGATAYAKEQGALENTDNSNDVDWLLSSLALPTRDSQGNYIYNTSDTVSNGLVKRSTPVNEKCGIRPALRINLDSNEWTYAGQVYDDGTVVKPEDVVRPTPTPVATPTVSPMPSATASAAVTTPPQSSETPTSAPTMQPTKSPVLTPTVSPTQSATPSVSTAPTSTPSATATMTPQPATTPANMGNQALQLPQQQSTPQAGANTGMTDDNAAKVSLIKQSKVSWKTAKNIKGRKLTASWKKVSEADGYQIQYAPNKKFKKAKSQTVKSTSVTLKKLKKKTTYFVRVRAYKAVDGKKVFGKWSSVKKVKIKK